MKTALIVIIALLIVGGAIYAFSTMDGGYFGNRDGEPVACTMDAKLCPDGSYVGRVGPNCEFAACPGVSATNGSTNGSGNANVNAGITGVVITSTTTTTTSAPKSLTVTYTDSGFSPRTAVVARGGQVTFVNKSSSRMHVASDDHPTHDDYPGDFDQGSSIGRDGTWTFTFSEVGSWGYHDHLNAGRTGTIVVQ